MNVTVRYDDSPYWDIQDISVIGTFNKFNWEEGKMRKEGNSWIYETECPPGEYRYKLLVNGEIQLNDPYNNLFEQDGDDTLWSLIMIDEDGRRLFNPNQYTVHVSDYALSPLVTEGEVVKSKKYYNVVADKKVVARFRFQNVTGVHAVTAAWYAPDGILFEYAENALCADNEQEEITLWFWLDTQEVMGAGEYGTWSLKLFVDGEYILEDLFTIESMNRVMRSQLV